MKRKQAETVKCIEFKLDDVVEAGNGNEQQQQQKEETPPKTTVGIYSATERFEEIKRVHTLPDDLGAVRIIRIIGMQKWKEGINEKVAQCLTKLAAAVVEKGRTAERRMLYCLNFVLAYAFNDDQEAVFAKNLSTLLRVPCLLRSVAAFSYSEGGNLADFLARFPQLLAEHGDEFPRQYDVDVYCENDTLVEPFIYPLKHYFADVKHWLVTLNKHCPAPTPPQTLRQCRLKFVHDRADTAEEMLKLFKEDFDKATDGHCTFVVRLDCPDFSLDEFHYTNDKTGEVLALTFKRAQVLLAEDSDEELADCEEGEKTAGEKAAKQQKDDGDDKNDDDGDDKSMVEWKTYMLVRCASAEQEQLLCAVDVPLVRNALSIIH